MLKNSPSKDRKFLRWNLDQIYLRPIDCCYIREPAETEELEVLPGSSP